jgi:outer membrane protein assembly factor BamB
MDYDVAFKPKLFISLGGRMTMVSKTQHVIHIMMLYSLLNLGGCIFQNEGVNVSHEYFIDRGADVLIGKNEYLYGVFGKVYCVNWEGEIIWETPNLGGRGMVISEEGILAETYDRATNSGGVAFLSFEGQILWQKKLELLSSTGLGASKNLLVAGSTKGNMWAFSPSGETLWTYDHTGAIEQLVVAPNDSWVIFNDDYHVNAIVDGKLMWSEYVGRISTYENKRTLAISPDSSYFVHSSRVDGPKIVVKTLKGEELWSFALENRLRSVIITHDSKCIIAGCHGYIYKFTSDGTLLWKSKVGADNKCLSITPNAEYIVVGAVGALSPFSRIIVLNVEGKPLWKAKSAENIFAVGISPNGSHVAFSNRLYHLYLFSNLPKELIKEKNS